MRVEREHAVVVGQGFGEASQGLERIGAVGERAQVIRAHREHLAIGRDGLLVAAKLRERVAAVVERIEMVRDRSQHLVVAGKRLVIALDRSQYVADVEQRGQVIRVDGERVTVARNCLFGPRQRRVRNAAVEMHAGIGRPQRNQLVKLRQGIGGAPKIEQGGGRDRERVERVGPLRQRRFDQQQSVGRPALLHPKRSRTMQRVEGSRSRLQDGCIELFGFGQRAAPVQIIGLPKLRLRRVGHLATSKDFSERSNADRNNPDVLTHPGQWHWRTDVSAPLGSRSRPASRPGGEGRGAQRTRAARRCPRTTVASRILTPIQSSPL